MVYPGTGINCVFCIANPTMAAQEPIPTMPTQHDRQHRGFCSFSPLRHCAFLILDLTRSRKGAKAQRRKGAKTRRVALSFWLHSQLTFMQKSSVCGGAKYIYAITSGCSTQHFHSRQTIHQTFHKSLIKNRSLTQEGHFPLANIPTNFSQKLPFQPGGQFLLDFL